MLPNLLTSKDFICSTPCVVIYLPNKTNEMHKYRILFQLLHLRVSVYMTILRVLIIVHQCCHVRRPMHVYLQQYHVKTEYVVMAKKLKFVKMFTCSACWCVHWVVIRWRVNLQRTVNSFKENWVLSKHFLLQNFISLVCWPSCQFSSAMFVWYLQLNKTFLPSRDFLAV